MYNFIKPLSVLLALHATIAADARTKHPATPRDTPHPKTGIDFVENKGQWTQEIKYKADIPGGNLFLTGKGFVYSYVDVSDLNRIHDIQCHTGQDASQEVVHGHAYWVNFEGANKDSRFVPSEKQAAYHNYFIGNDRSQWASSVAQYGSVTQQNVYDGIDMAIYSEGPSLKYDFVVAAGADPSKIKLSFEGVTPQLSPSGNLVIKTSVNEIVEQAPYTYQVIDNQKVTVPSKYGLRNGKVTFEFPAGYNKSYPLVIDPTLVFATYSGGTGSAYFAHSTTYGPDGSMYVAALGAGTLWPTTPGAFQSIGGALSNNVNINKYNATGTTLVYSTYFSGSSVEVPNAMRVNRHNELVVTGATNSSNLPTTTGAYSQTLKGTSDLFVVHFNATGTALIGSTFMGGNGVEPTLLDIGNGTGGSALGNVSATTSPCELFFDENDNIWVVSNSSSVDFPVTANALQSASGGGHDGVIFQLDPTCSNLLYSTYLGGSGKDAIFMGMKKNNGHIVVCGGTASTDFPTSANALHTTHQGGGDDGFVTIFEITPTASSIISSTYLGTSAQDNATKIQIDKSQNIYVLGRTQGDYPISANVWSMSGADVYIDILSPDLTSSILSTRVGRQQGSVSSSYLPSAFLLDNCENVYVAGLTPSVTSGMPLTADALETTPRNFWFCVLEPNFSELFFGSYFGSTSNDHAHSGTSHFDPEGIVYHSVCSTGGDFPTTPGVYAPDKLGNSNDVLSFKLDFEATGVKSDFELDPLTNPKDTGCVPFQVMFHNKSSKAEECIWDFGDGSPLVTSNAPTHTYTVPGTYTITLYAKNDTTCIKSDTAYLRVTVLETNLPEITANDTLLCYTEQQINLHVDIANPSPNNIITWQPASAIISGANQATPTVNPSLSQEFYVTVKDTIPGICGFSVTDTVRIDLSPRDIQIINNDTAVCLGTVIPIAATSTPGYTYRWSPATGVSDTTVLSPFITPAGNEVYTLTASYPGCLDTTVAIAVEVQKVPTVDLGPDITTCQWKEIALGSLVAPFRNDYTYQWSPATPNLSSHNGPTTDFLSDTSITYTLSVKTPIGCEAKDSIHVTVFPGGFGSVIADTGYCPNGSVKLWATGGVRYEWSPSYGLSDVSLDTPIAQPETSTEYTVLITDIHNCLDTEKVFVKVYPEAIVNVPDTVLIYPGERYHVDAQSNASYFSWFPQSGISDAGLSDPYLFPETGTRYYVEARTEHGCVANDSIYVIVKETVLDMPNAFIPSSGSNANFKVSKRGIAQLKNFVVYNRWGNKVFETQDIEQGWDGRFKGQEQPMGVYIYVIEAVDNTGKIFTQNGNVTLIR